MTLSIYFLTPSQPILYPPPRMQSIARSETAHTSSSVGRAFGSALLRESDADGLGAKQPRRVAPAWLARLVRPASAGLPDSNKEVVSAGRVGRAIAP